MYLFKEFLHTVCLYVAGVEIESFLIMGTVSLHEDFLELLSNLIAVLLTVLIYIYTVIFLLLLVKSSLTVHDILII